MKKVLLGAVVMLVLLVGGCFAVMGMAANEVDKAIQEEERHDAPTAVNVGTAFAHDDWKVARGWKIRGDAMGMAEVAAEVTNRADRARAMFLTFTLLRGQKVLASIDCATDEIEPGQSQAVTCLSGDDLPKNYGKVTVEDTF